MAPSSKPWFFWFHGQQGGGSGLCELDESLQPDGLAWGGVGGIRVGGGAHLGEPPSVPCRFSPSCKPSHMVVKGSREQQEKPPAMCKC